MRAENGTVIRALLSLIISVLCLSLLCAAGPAWSDAIPAPGTPEAAADSDSLDLPELKVSGTKQDVRALEVKTDFLLKIPNTMNDPIRALSFLPGVTVQSDLNIRPFIRGGNSDQTEVVLNGIPLLQPYHVGGVFSVFNAGTIESSELYREDFPVEYAGALSGVVRMKTRPPSLSEAHLQTDLSLLRGDLFTEIPLVKNRLSVYGAAQSFLLNHSLHGLLNITSGFSDDSQFQREIQSYRDHINLPDFEDYGWGASYFANDRMQINYAGSLSLDDYAVVVPAQTNIFTNPPDNGGNPVVPVIPKAELSRTRKLSIDSISSVDIHNQTHFINVPWDMSPENFIENDFGYQSQRWNVDFKKEAATDDPLYLSQSVQAFDYRLVDTYSPSPDQKFKFGLSYDYKYQEYRAEMPYVLYDVIVNSNLDMLEGLGYFTDDGFQIEKEDSTKSNFDYLGGYPSRIRFSHAGSLEEHFGGVFFSHSFKLPSGTVAYGIRGEYQSTSGEFFPGPRLSYTMPIGKRDELLFTAGLYSQNNLAYYERDQNPGLLSEKSAQTGLQWSHKFSDGYRVVLQNYYKRYFDLVSPALVPDGKITLGGILLPSPRTTLSKDQVASLKATLDTTTNFQALPDSVKQLAYPVFGDLEFAYANTGVGNSVGSELSFFYNPDPKWNGWISLDLSISNRRDADDRPYYPYGYNRPLVLNWVNYFDMPSDYDISFTYRFALGQPYTPYSGTLDGTGSLDPITVGARNSGRLAPYSRLDIRLSRNSRLWNRDFKSYIEVWNSMNDPNYFARDSQTGELKAAQLNWPFPLLFLGVAYQL